MMPVWVVSLIGAGASIVGGLITAVWLLAGINKDVERMKQDIGTSDSGMRQTVHKTSNAVTALEAEIRAAVSRLNSLYQWKHDVAEAYLPRAVDEHERRLNRLDSKVFNGGAHK